MSNKKLNKNQKINYVKKTLFNNDIEYALGEILEKEDNLLSHINIIKDILSDELILNKLKDNNKDEKNIKLFIYSKIVKVLLFQNKKDLIEKYLNSFDEETLNKLIKYEKDNNTDFSKDTMFSNYYKEEKVETLSINDNRGMKKRKKVSSQKYIILSIVMIFLFIIIAASFKLYDSYLEVKKYDNKIYNGIYLGDRNLSKTKISELENIINKEKEKILSKNITFTNDNDNYTYSYNDLKINIDDSIIDKIKKYNDSLTLLDKLKMTDNKKYKVFDFSANCANLDNITNMLKEKVNTEKVNDGLFTDENHNVYYRKAVNGFTLDEEKTKNEIKNALDNIKENINIKLIGNVVKNESTNESLSSVNTKIATYTTYFVNSGNRGHNIVLASTRLNETLVMPSKEFSYLKEVGPYGTSNGYLSAPVYLNGDVTNQAGGGVCQLATTLYNAALISGLKITSRRNHTFKPNYVPGGLDATVYSTTTDFKFRNEYKYPVYIISYVKGNYLTVDIWSNDKAKEGKTYEPFSKYNNGGYDAYLKIFQDGNLIETKYLNRSVYKVH